MNIDRILIHRILIHTLNRVIIFAVIIYVFVAVIHVFQSARVKGESVGCMDNLRRLGRAFNTYDQDWDEHLPPAYRWTDCIDSDRFIRHKYKSSIFHCPAASGSYGYAMNVGVSSASVNSLDYINWHVLLYETDNRSRNAYGTLSDLAQVRHGNLNCLFCDGTVRWVNQYTTTRWIWNVSTAVGGRQLF